MSYCKKIEPTSAITHFIGFGLSIAALVLMIVYATIYGTAVHIVGASIFGSSLILLYAFSTVYHCVPKQSSKKNLFLKLDYTMIFVLIAGTYTPIALAMPQRGWGWTLFGVAWGLAALGIILKLSGFLMNSKIPTLIYLAMGWMIVIAIYPIVTWLSTAGIIWLFIGGLCYSIGCIFHHFDTKHTIHHWFSHHDIFHIFVIAGSFSHFWLVLKYVINA